MNNYCLKELIPEWLAFCCATELLACPTKTGKFCPFEGKHCNQIEPGDWNNLLKLLYGNSEEIESLKEEIKNLNSYIHNIGVAYGELEE